eukprot:6473752-Amphidinium_carterae.1
MKGNVQRLVATRSCGRTYPGHPYSDGDVKLPHLATQLVMILSFDEQRPTPTLVALPTSRSTYYGIRRGDLGSSGTPGNAATLHRLP